jgi:hypothetical protein
MKKKSFKAKKLKLEQVEDDLCLPFLYDLPLPSSLIYIQSIQELRRFEEIATKRVDLIGIDTETEPMHGHKTSLIQLAVRYQETSGSMRKGGEENKEGDVIEERIFILDLLQLSGEDHELTLLNQIFQEMFQNESIIKIAHGLKQDVTELVASYPTLTSLNRIAMVLETNSMHQKLNPQIVLPVSLKYLARHYLNSNLVKAHQCSSWGSRPLTPGQLNYAACDALVLLRLYDAMCFEIEDVFLECDLQECMATIDLTQPCDSPTKHYFSKFPSSPSPSPTFPLSPARLSPSMTSNSSSDSFIPGVLRETWNLTGKKERSDGKSSRQKKRRKVFESGVQENQDEGNT